MPLCCCAPCVLLRVWASQLIETLHGRGVRFGALGGGKSKSGYAQIGCADCGD